jgi:hypothetical protein
MPSTFMTYFGSRLLGMDVTWDNTTATTLAITMVVNSYSRILIAGYDNLGTGANGITGGAWPLVTPFKCDTAVAPFPFTVTTTAKYRFGIVWANPTTTAIPKYDGVMATSQISM